MRNLDTVIALLTKVEKGADIYDISEASWLRRFREVRPECINITTDITPGGPYFYAELTSKGVQYLQELSKEHDAA